jgi:putative phosphoesterase
VDGRIAVITDVHGNGPALRAALSEIDAEGGVEEIFCLGDMIAIGPDSNEVLELLFGRPDVTMLSGNHEEAVLAAAAGRDPGTPGTERTHHEWIASRLDRTFIPRLETLPRSLTWRHGDRSVLLLHYHRDGQGNLLPVDREPALEKLEALYRGYEVDAVCFGHHHPVHHFVGPRRTYLNPGSLGCCEYPVARYAIIGVGSEGLSVELRAAPYDNRDFLASYYRLGVPAADFIIATFHGNQRG